MYNAQQAQGPSRPQQLGMQSGAPAAPHTSPNENASKEKLAAYVYEYLIHSGAAKTAETFKAEVLASTQTSKTPTISETGPGFLQNWWLVFWDLYCAAPERRDDNPHSQEAKYFYQTFVSENQFHGPPMMNGMHAQFAAGPSPMGMAPGPDGMMPGAAFPGRFPPGRGIPGAPPASVMPPGAQFAMFAGDPRMAAQRMPPGAMRMQGAFPGMRPGQPPGIPGPYGPRPGYMDSPGAAFPPQPMMPNGGVMCSQAAMSLSSPSAGPPISQSNPQAPVDPNNPDQRFMLMPTSSSQMGFGMGEQGMGGTPITSLAQSTSNGSAHENPQQIPMMNGEEIKQSPASTPRGANGTGTPGAGGGPGSQAPGSAQSGGAQSGGGGGAMNGPESNQDPPPQPPNPPQSGGLPHGEDDEITKIKQSIFEDAKQFDPKEAAEMDQQPFYSGIQ